MQWEGRGPIPNNSAPRFHLASPTSCFPPPLHSFLPPCCPAFFVFGMSFFKASSAACHCFYIFLMFPDIFSVSFPQTPPPASSPHLNSLSPDPAVSVLSGTALHRLLSCCEQEVDRHTLESTSWAHVSWTHLEKLFGILNLRNHLLDDYW